MPFYLPPITRRQFVVRTLAAGAGALMPRALWAEAPAVDPDLWALFSDTHIAESTAGFWRGESMYDNAQRVNNELFALPKRPCGLIHLGDCAFKVGRAGDYETFQSLLKPVSGSGIPIHLMVGNHDERQTFWKSLSKETAGPRPVANKHVAIVEHPRVNFFLLDSLEETDASPGRVGVEQCTWLARELDARADRPALVCVHHNPLIDAKPDKISGLTDTPALLHVVSPRKQVKALIFGHTHTWQLAKYGGLHLINLPAVGYPSKSDSPTGWVECALRDNAMRLTLHSRDTTQKDHLRPIEFLWRKG
jgi:calcineurin-like phosphoesterase family protein